MGFVGDKGKSIEERESVCVRIKEKVGTLLNELEIAHVPVVRLVEKFASA